MSSCLCRMWFWLLLFCGSQKGCLLARQRSCLLAHWLHQQKGNQTSVTNNKRQAPTSRQLPFQHPPFQSFVHLFVLQLTPPPPPHPLMQSSYYSCTYPSIHPFIYFFIHSFTPPPTHPCNHSFTHLPIHPSIHPCIHPSIHAFIHSVFHSFSLSFIHSFIHSFIPLKGDCWFWTDLCRWPPPHLTSNQPLPTLVY